MAPTARPPRRPATLTLLLPLLLLSSQSLPFPAAAAADSPPSSPAPPRSTRRSRPTPTTRPRRHATTTTSNGGTARPRPLRRGGGSTSGSGFGSEEPSQDPPKPVLSVAAPAAATATHDGLRFWQYMLAGSVAGVVEHTAMFPVDTLKTHMQVASPPCRPTLSLGAALRTAVAGESGALALYRGLPAMALGAGPAHTVYFSVYEFAKSRLTDR